MLTMTTLLGGGRLVVRLLEGVWEIEGEDGVREMTGAYNPATVKIAVRTSFWLKDVRRRHSRGIG